MRKATFSALANAAIHINVRPLLSSERKGQDSRLNPPLLDPCEACAGNGASYSVTGQTLSRAQVHAPSLPCPPSHCVAEQGSSAHPCCFALRSQSPMAIPGKRWTSNGRVWAGLGCCSCAPRSFISVISVALLSWRITDGKTD